MEFFDEALGITTAGNYLGEVGEVLNDTQNPIADLMKTITGEYLDRKSFNDALKENSPNAYKAKEYMKSAAGYIPGIGSGIVAFINTYEWALSRAFDYDKQQGK